MSSPEIQHHAFEHMSDASALELDDTLWWSVGRQAILGVLLDRAARGGPLSTILEIGCGTGGNLGMLSRYGKVAACEPSPVLADRAKSRGTAHEVTACDFFDFRHESLFDLTCCFDVLEHVEDDHGFVRRASELTRPGGFFLASVPACPWLYSEHDRLLHHQRRYTRRGLVRLMQSAGGFQAICSTYFVTTLFPIVAAARLKDKILARLGKRRDHVSVGQVPSFANQLLIELLKAEAAVARVVRLPIGVWTMALGRKE
jgi:SAM-dependent methyltransferase